MKKLRLSRVLQMTALDAQDYCVCSHVPMFYKHRLISIVIMMFHRNDAKRAGMKVM